MLPYRTISVIDMSHCQVALEKIKAVKNDLRGSFVMDRVYFCIENIDYMSNSGYLFMCMGKSGRMLETGTPLASDIHVYFKYDVFLYPPYLSLPSNLFSL